MVEMLKVITTGRCASCGYPGTARCLGCQDGRQWAHKPGPLHVQMCQGCNALPGELHDDDCTITTRMSGAKDASEPYDPDAMGEGPIRSAYNNPKLALKQEKTDDLAL